MREVVAKSMTDPPMPPLDPPELHGELRPMVDGFVGWIGGEEDPRYRWHFLGRMVDGIITILPGDKIYRIRGELQKGTDGNYRGTLRDAYGFTRDTVGTPGRDEAGHLLRLVGTLGPIPENYRLEGIDD